MSEHNAVVAVYGSHEGAEQVSRRRLAAAEIEPKLEVLPASRACQKHSSSARD
ncbi:MAG: hypothetical protein M3Y27_24885 [Acidobacteriota bacterium]|nr:hypothetical protein [Acidobacteriota bacterium]